MPSNGAGSRLRHEEHFAAKLDHYWPAADGVTWRQRASFTETEARRASAHIYVLTSRRYSVYECPWNGCDAWHIRRCPLRPEDLARPA